MNDTKELTINCYDFIEFLELLSSNQLINDFTKRLMITPNIEENIYFNIGDRWCGIDDLLKDNEEIRHLLNQFAFKARDKNFSFSAGNLKAQYIPNEDFVDNGSAFIIYSLVGSNWKHVVWVNNDLAVWNEILTEIET
tara:strand:- start:242 stop:655 length:414 start_codon:yes stop_codon:yes gene_type:complete